MELPRWILDVCIVTSVLSYVTVPLLTLVHEMGHALAVVRAGRRPLVVVGKHPPLISWRFRSFDLRFHPQWELDDEWEARPGEITKDVLGVCSYSPEGLTVAQLRAIASAGPHASFAAGLVFAAAAFALSDSHAVLTWIAALSAFFAWTDGIGNLIPRRTRWFVTDGYKMNLYRGLDPDLVPFPSTSTAPPVLA